MRRKEASLQSAYVSPSRRSMGSIDFLKRSLNFSSLSLRASSALLRSVISLKNARPTGSPSYVTRAAETSTFLVTPVFVTILNS